MKLSQWYKSQLVNHLEMRTAFEDGEAADRLIVKDTAIFGVISGMAVNEDAPASRTIFIDLGLAYGANGARIEIPSGPQAVDTTIDEAGDPTELVNVGWFKVLSVFVRQDRKFSMPVLDGDLQTVQYVNEEDFEIFLLQGTEAASNPVPPALQSDAVLLVDIVVTKNQTTIETADMSFVRRQDTVRFEGTNVSLVEGTINAGLAALATIVDDIIGGAISLASDFITYAATGTWADGTSITAVTVKGALDETRTDLASTANAIGGTRKVGGEEFSVGSVTTTAGTLYSQLLALGDTTGLWNQQTATSFADGQQLPASNLWMAISTFVGRIGESSSASNSGGARVGMFALGNWTSGSLRDWFQQLANTTAANDGALRVGAEAVVQSPTSFSAGTVRSQLTALLTAVNARVLKAGDTMTGDLQATRVGLGYLDIDTIGANTTLAATIGAVRVRQPAAGTFNIALPTPSGGNPMIAIRFDGTITAGRSIYIVAPADVGTPNPTDYYGLWLGAQTSAGGYVFIWDGVRWRILMHTGTTQANGGGAGA